MKRPNIIFLDRDTIGPTVSISQPESEHEWSEYGATASHQIIERAKNADIIITNKVPLSSETIAQLPILKMVAVAATGYDVVDVVACTKQNITVSNVRGYAVHTVPEHTFALILALRRNLMGYRQDVIEGAWEKAENFCFFTHPISDLAGSTLGIIGAGVIGQAVAKIAQAFGMNVLLVEQNIAKSSQNGQYCTLEEALAISDVLTLHLPLLASTHNMLSYAEFSLMEKSPLLINTARGGLVDEKALVAALDKNQISGAGFDVLTSEPPKPDNPLLTITQRSNVIITPHVAWASTTAMQTLWDQTISHIDNFISDKPSNVVN